MCRIAVGDSVNTASRRGARASVDLGAAARHEIEIRGRVEGLVVRTFTSARDLPVLGRGALKKVLAAE